MNKHVLSGSRSSGWLARGLIAVGMVSGASCPAQQAPGRILFDNRVPGLVDAPIYDSSLVTRATGESYRAQLYVGTSIESLLPIGTATSFSSGAGAGYVVPESVIVPGLAPGTQVYVDVRAWDTNFGATFEEAGFFTGRSNVLLVTLGGAGGDPDGVPLEGLTSFAIGAGFLLSQGFPDAREIRLEGKARASGCGIPVGTKFLQHLTVGETGEVTVSSEAGGVDTVLEVYSPFYNPGSILTLLDCGDAPPGPTARVRFRARAERNYYLVVSSRDGATGSVKLDYQLDPPDPRPRLLVHRAKGGLELLVFGRPEVPYTIESTESLSAPTWEFFMAGVADPGGELLREAPIVSGNHVRYFRAVE